MKLPILSGHDVIKILSKQGFKVARQKGSHIILVKESDTGKRGVVVPNHKEIARLASELVANSLTCHRHAAGNYQAKRHDKGRICKISIRN